MTPNSFDYDVIVIGGGTAGLAAYRRSVELGARALIIERHDFVTTCASEGCMPSKLLIAAAEHAHQWTRSSTFGFDVDLRPQWDVLWSRVRTERDRFVQFVRDGAQRIPASDRLIGTAVFTAPHTVQVGSQSYTARHFILATGAQPVLPELFQPFSQDVLTHHNVFELTSRPERLAVIGAGVIGLELGMAFHHLGSQVHLFHPPGKPLLQLSTEFQTYLRQSLHHTFSFEDQHALTRVERQGSGWLLFWGGQSAYFDHVLVTAGRRPSLSSLHLDSWISEDPLSLFQPSTLQLGSYPLYLAGDLHGHHPLLHEAAFDGRLAAERALNPQAPVQRRPTPMSIVFTDPQIIQVGTIPGPGDAVLTGRASFDDQGRSRVMLMNRGRLALYFHPTSLMFLGAEMIGPRAEHLAHSFAWLIEKNTTLTEFLQFPFYHPVIEEGVRTALRNAAEQQASSLRSF